MKLLLCLLLLNVVKSEDWIERFKPGNRDKFIQEINKERADVAKKYGVSNMHALNWSDSLALQLNDSNISCLRNIGGVHFGDERSTHLEPDSAYSDYFINITAKATGLKRNGARGLKEYIEMYKDEFFGNTTHYFGYANDTLQSRMSLVMVNPEQTEIWCRGDFKCSDVVSPPGQQPVTISAVGVCRLGRSTHMANANILKGSPGSDCRGVVTAGLCGEWDAPPEEPTQAPEEEGEQHIMVVKEEEEPEKEVENREAMDDIFSGGFQVNFVTIFKMVTIGVLFFY